MPSNRRLFIRSIALLLLGLTLGTVALCSPVLWSTDRGRPALVLVGSLVIFLGWVPFTVISVFAAHHRGHTPRPRSALLSFVVGLIVPWLLIQLYLPAAVALAYVLTAVGIGLGLHRSPDSTSEAAVDSETRHDRAASEERAQRVRALNTVETLRQLGRQDFS